MPDSSLPLQIGGVPSHHWLLLDSELHPKAREARMIGWRRRPDNLRSRLELGERSPLTCPRWRYVCFLSGDLLLPPQNAGPAVLEKPDR